MNQTKTVWSAFILGVGITSLVVSMVIAVDDIIKNNNQDGADKKQ